MLKEVENSIRYAKTAVAEIGFGQRLVGNVSILLLNNKFYILGFVIGMKEAK